jgi:2-deoxy-D-gluconate 3-dehydrogenase
MAMNLFDLAGKVAIVTGTGAGLGQGMTLALARAGADIVGVDYAEMSETAKQVEAAGRRFLGINANLLNTQLIQSIIEQTVQTFGKVDILVNDAGINRIGDANTGAALNYTEKDWDDVMSINLKTVFFFSQAVARQYIKQGNGGKIINIASLHSFQGGNVPPYTASKNGVLGLTRLMANQWAQYNININAIAPGYMATNQTTRLRSDAKRAAVILDRIPAGRWGAPEDLQGPVVFLASSASDYVNGYTLAVDGGWLTR